jgi:hypothetical protein
MRKDNPSVESWRLKSGPLASTSEGMTGNFMIPTGGIGNKSRVLIKAISSKSDKKSPGYFEAIKYLPESLPVWEMLLVEVLSSNKQPFGEMLDSITEIWFHPDEIVVQFRPTITVEGEKTGKVALCKLT